MYESPINLWSCQVNDEVARKYAEHTENLIYQEVLNVGVSVDRKELIKALEYDRGQYDKGYADGYVAGCNASLDKLKDKICKVIDDGELH